MLVLRTSKTRNTRLRPPKEVYGINWSSPLVRGLNFAVPALSPKTLRELVFNSARQASGLGNGPGTAKLAPRPPGRGLVGDGGNTGADTFNFNDGDYVPGDGNPASFGLLYWFHPDAASATAGVAEFCSTSTFTQNWRGFQIVKGTDDSIYFSIGNGGTSSTTGRVRFTSPAVDIGREMALCFSTSGTLNGSSTDCGLFVDGVDNKTHNQGTATGNVDFSSHVGLGAYKFSTTTKSEIFGMLRGAWAKNYQVEAEEAAALAAYPWDIYKTRGRKVFFATPGGVAPSATAAQTLPAATQAASGAQAFTATAAQTFGALTQQASGTAGSTTGTAAQTAPALEQSASASEILTGAGAQTLSSTEQAGSGSQVFTGAAAQTVASVEQSAAGTTGATVGTGVQTTPALEQSASGSEILTGAGGQALPAATQSGTGAMQPAGTAAQTLAATTQAGSGAQVFTGTGAQTLASLEQLAAGTTGATFGTGVHILPAVTQAGAGVEILTGAGAQTLPAVTQDADGLMQPSATAAMTLPAVTQTAAGEGGETPTVTIPDTRKISIAPAARSITITLN